MKLGGGVSQGLVVREDAKKGIYLEGVIEESTRSLRQTIEIMQKGAKQRHVGATQMNLESSRSHSVFSVSVESKTEVRGIWKLRRSQFHFVDLAGSERQKKTEAQGERLKEGCNINKSLSVLGSVINALVEATAGKKVHVRYRDSKLTFLLRDSLGGNSRTAIIANVSPASGAFHETLSTLQFAQRAKLIKNKARLNEDTAGDAEALKSEIRRLKEELENARALGGPQNLPQGLSSSQIQLNPVLLQKDVIASETARFLELEESVKVMATQLLQNQTFLEAERVQRESQLVKYQQSLSVIEQNELQLTNLVKHFARNQSATNRNDNGSVSSKGFGSLPTDLMSSTDSYPPSSTLSPLGGHFDLGFSHSESLLPETDEKELENCNREELLQLVSSLQLERDQFKHLLANHLHPMSQLYRENLRMAARLADLEPLAPKPADHRQLTGLLQRVLKCLEASTTDRQHLLQVLALDKDPLAHSRLGVEVQNLRHENTALRESLLNLDVQRREVECTLRESKAQLEEKERALTLHKNAWDSDIRLLKARVEEASAQLLLKEQQTRNSTSVPPSTKQSAVMLQEPLGVSTTSSHEQLVQSWEANDRLIELNRQVEFLQEEIKNLNEMLLVEKTLLTEEKNASNLLIAAQVSLREQLLVAQAANDSLQKEMERLKLEPEEWRSKSSDMMEETKDLEDTQKSESTSSVTLSELLQQIEQLKIELLQSEEARDTLAQSLDFFQEEVTRQKLKRQTEVQALQQQLSVCSSLQTHPEHRALVEAQHNTKLLLEEKTLREACLQESNSALQEMLASVQISYSNCEKTLLATQHENRELGSLYEQLQESLAESNSERDGALKQLAEVEAEVAKNKEEFTLRLQQASKAIAQHAEVKAELASAHMQIQDLASRNQALGEQVQEASKLADQMLAERNQYLRLSNSLQNGMTELRALLNQTARSKDEVIFWDEITKSIIHKQEVAILTKELSQKEAALTDLGLKVDQMNQTALDLASRLADVENQSTRPTQLEFKHTKNNLIGIFNLSSNKKARLEKVAEESNTKENFFPSKGIQGLPRRQILREVDNLEITPSRNCSINMHRGQDQKQLMAQPLLAHTPRKTLTGLNSDEQPTEPAKPAQLWRLFESLCSRDDELFERFWASAHVHKELVTGLTCKSPEELKQQIQNKESNKEACLGKRQTTPFMLARDDWDQVQNPWNQSSGSSEANGSELKENIQPEEMSCEQEQS